jgi:hypothetical protein
VDASSDPSTSPPTLGLTDFLNSIHIQEEDFVVRAAKAL